MINYGICLIYLGIISITDLKRRSVSIPISGIFAVVAILLHIYKTTIWMDVLAAVSIGCGVLIVSLITKQAIGSGDGVALIVTGLYLGFYRNMQVFLWSMIGVFVTGVVLMLVTKKDWKSKIPYVPYLFLGEVVMLIWGI